MKRAPVHRQAILGSLRHRRNRRHSGERIGGVTAVARPDAPTKTSAAQPELVVCIVSALGSNIEPVIRALREAFKAVDYETRDVRVSDFLENASGLLQKDRSAKTTRAAWLMDLGDSIRKAADMGSAAICLAVLDINKSRGRPEEFVDPERGDRPGIVTIIRSAKRGDEIQALRQIYGSRLLVIGVSAAEEERRDHLMERLRVESVGRPAHWYSREADRLMRRDQDDATKRYGQQLRKAFALADAFVWVRRGTSPDASVQRIVRAWFGHPFVTPTRDEQAMYAADAAKYRSAAAGRQVGAVVVDAAGEILVTGTNDVPRPGGGQYWSGDEPDYRDYVLNFEMNDRLKLDVARDVVQRLQKERWLRKRLRGLTIEGLVDKAVQKKGPLAEGRIKDLIEFGRIMHAEMAAICTAARRGTPLAGGTLCTTTYPCHECARLIIGTGIRRVVYIDPYPKSQVQTLFGDLVTANLDDSEAKVQIVPFDGVAPVLFARVFAMSQRDRTIDGEFKEWVPTPLAVRLAEGVPPVKDETALLEQFQSTSIGQAWSRQGR